MNIDFVANVTDVR